MSGGGDLRSIVVLSERATANDGYGNWQETWIKRMTRRAQIMSARGSEAIDATKSQGRGFVVIRIRNDPDTRKITSDWKATDGLSGVEYNVRSARDPDQGGPGHNRWIDLTAEYGQAIG